MKDLKSNRVLIFLSYHFRKVRMRTVFLTLGVIHFVYSSYPSEVQPKCKWDVRYCTHDEILCNPEESIYLDSKEEESNNKDYCFASGRYCSLMEIQNSDVSFSRNNTFNDTSFLMLITFP